MLCEEYCKKLQVFHGNPVGCFVALFWMDEYLALFLILSSENIKYYRKNFLKIFFNANGVEYAVYSQFQYAYKKILTNSASYYCTKWHFKRNIRHYMLNEYTYGLLIYSALVKSWSYRCANLYPKTSGENLRVKFL